MNQTNAWAYTPEFEAKMDTAFKQIAAGEYDTFETIDDLIADLNSRKNYIKFIGR